MIRRVAWMTRIKLRTAEYRMTNDERWNRSRSAGACAACREIFFEIDRIHSFDVRCWMFDVHQFLSRLDWTFAARGDARMLLDGINDLIPKGGIGDPVTQALHHQKFCSRYGPGRGTAMCQRYQ